MTDTFRPGEPSCGYPEFPPTLSEEELGIYFHLCEADLKLINDKRRDHNRLGFALQLAIPRYLGRCLSDLNQVPAYVVVYVGEQLGIGDPLTVLRQYGERDGTARTHAAEIRRAYRWSDFADHKEALRTALDARAWETVDGPTALQIYAVTWLRKRKVLLPDRTPLQELVSSARKTAESRMYAALEGALTDEQRSRLDNLLPSGNGRDTLDRLRKGPHLANWGAFDQALERVRLVRGLGLTGVDVSEVPHSRIAHLARYGFKAKPSRRQALDDERQRAILLATVKHLESASVDDALDVFDTLVSNDFLSKPRRRSNKEKLASYPELMRALGRLLAFVYALFEAAEEHVDTTTGEIGEALANPRSLRELISALAHRPDLDLDLEEAIALLTELVPTPDSDSQEARRRAMLDCFDTLKKYLPSLLETVAFHATPEARPVLQALRTLPALMNRSDLGVNHIDATLLEGSWRTLALQAPHLLEGTVDVRAYAFCLVEQFHRLLRDREIFAYGGRKCGNPQGGLYSDAEWQRKKSELLDSTQLPADPTAHLAELRSRMDSELRVAASHLPPDSQVELGPGGQVLFHRLPPAPMSASSRKLRKDVADMMPKGDLPELLLEVFKKTNGQKAFTTLSGAPARVPHLATTLSAVLVARGCNVGFEPVSGNGKGLSSAQIDHADREFCRADTYDAFNTLMLEFQQQIDLAQTWGGGRVAFVDGMRFVVPRTQIPARLSADGTPELTWLTMISDQAIQLAGKVVAGTADKSLHVLDVVYERHTRLDKETHDATTASSERTTIVGETGDYEDIAFGLLSLSGYNYAPVPHHLARTKLWRLDATADYGPLDKATRSLIDLGLIERNWDDILRLVCAVHSGAIRAHDVLRILVRKSRVTSLGQAIASYGRIMKTRHLLALFDDPDFRRRIETQSTVHEARHKLAEKIFHGNSGQVHRYHEGMEDNLSALGLVLNAIVLFNTFYMDQIIKRMRERGRPVFPQDVAQLSPFIFAHINMKGRYAFELPHLLEGLMRPLPEPEDISTEASED